MRILNESLLSAGDMSGNLNSSPLSLEFAFGYAIQCVISGASPAGTLILQGSNDAPPDANFQFASFAPTNWTDISGTSTTISATGTVLFNAQSAYYRYVRASFTAGMGSAGSLSVTGNTKGI